MWTRKAVTYAGFGTILVLFAPFINNLQLLLLGITLLGFVAIHSLVNTRPVEVKITRRFSASQLFAGQETEVDLVIQNRGRAIGCLEVYDQLPRELGPEKVANHTIVRLRRDEALLARYRLVAVACLVLFAAERGVAWWDAARAGRLVRAIPSLAAAALIALAVNAPLASYPKERGFALQWEKIGDRHRLEGRPAEALAAFEKALASDAHGWQGLDPELKRGETLLRMARARWDLGDRAGALRTRDALLAGLDVVDARSERLDRDARDFRTQLASGS